MLLKIIHKLSSSVLSTAAIKSEIKQNHEISKILIQ